ncbi:hypothetical protein EBR57_08660, partial [bacterium]|nr:hypothetical protein [bacterium]
IIEIQPFLKQDISVGLLISTINFSERVLNPVVKLNGNRMALTWISPTQLTASYMVSGNELNGRAVIQIIATDFSGNESILVTQNLNIDTVSPTLNAWVSRADTNQNWVDLAIENEMGTQLTVIRDGVIVTSFISDRSPITIPVPLVLGKNQFQVRSVDRAGNGQLTSNLEVVFRTDPPEMTGFALSSNPVKAGPLSVSINLNEYVTGNIIGKMTCGTSSILAASINVAGQTVAVGFDVPVIMDGFAKVIVEGIENGAGNKTSLSFNLDIDNAVPQVVSKNSLIRYVKAGQYPYQIQVSEQVSTISVQFNGTRLPLSKMALVDGGVAYTFDAMIQSGDRQGTASILIHMEDTAGNQTDSTDSQWVVDTEAPTVNRLVSDSRPVSVGDIDLSFKISEAIKGKPLVTINNTPMILESVVASDNNLIYRVVSTILPAERQGISTVSVSIIDLAGNESIWTGNGPVIDTIRPSINVTSTPSAVSLGVCEINFNISEPVGSVAVTFNDRAIPVIQLDDGLFVACPTIDATERQGTAPLWIVAEDVAGNKTEIQFNGVWIDTISPSFISPMVMGRSVWTTGNRQMTIGLSEMVSTVS